MFLHKTLVSALVTHFKNVSPQKRIKQLSLESQVISGMRHSLMLRQVGKPLNNSLISGTFPHPHTHCSESVASASRIFAGHIDQVFGRSYYVTLPALELSHSYSSVSQVEGLEVCAATSSFLELSQLWVPIQYRTNIVFYICT